MTKRAKRMIDAGLRAKIALEALRGAATVHPTQVYARKKQLQEQAVRAFDPGVGREDQDVREREIEKLPPRGCDRGGCNPLARDG